MAAQPNSQAAPTSRAMARLTGIRITVTASRMAPATAATRARQPRPRLAPGRASTRAAVTSSWRGKTSRASIARATTKTPGKMLGCDGKPGVKPPPGEPNEVWSRPTCAPGVISEWPPMTTASRFTLALDPRCSIPPKTKASRPTDPSTSAVPPKTTRSLPTEAPGSTVTEQPRQKTSRFNWPGWTTILVPNETWSRSTSVDGGNRGGRQGPGERSGQEGLPRPASAQAKAAEDAEAQAGRCRERLRPRRAEADHDRVVALQPVTAGDAGLEVSLGSRVAGGK